MRLICQFPLAKKLQTQTVNTEKLHKTLLDEKTDRKMSVKLTPSSLNPTSFIQSDFPRPIQRVQSHRKIPFYCDFCEHSIFLLINVGFARMKTVTIQITTWSQSCKSNLVLKKTKLNPKFLD